MDTAPNELPSLREVSGSSVVGIGMELSIEASRAS